MKEQRKHDESERRLMEALCRFIEARSHESITLQQLSKQAHLSPGHLQRRFRAVVGVSPKEFHESCRLRRLKDALKQRRPVADAAYGAGFGSMSRLYERVDSRLGMTPRQYARRGRGLAISYAETETILGRVLLAATDRGLCFIQFGASSEALLALLRQEFPEAEISPMAASGSEPFAGWAAALAEYLEGASAALDLPLDIRGTAFQMKVWKYLQSIPPGTVRSYTQVARAIGRPTAVRAVAHACARNAVAIAVPCHRVIRGSGALAGYRWGLERKRALLAIEARPRAPEPGAEGSSLAPRLSSRRK